MMKLIQNWRDAWRLWSIWALALLMAVPEIYNEMLYSGVIDMTEWPSLTRVIQSLAFIGIVVRLVRQNMPYDQGGGYGSGYNPSPYLGDDGEEAP